MPARAREGRLRKAFRNLPADQQEALRYAWELSARRNQMPPRGDWLYWLFLGGRAAGKALALDTPVPTPAGWTTMGELRVGDALFSATGRPCLVAAVSPVMLGRDCAEVRFSDGSAVVADLEHLWLTEDRATRKALGRRQPQNGRIGRWQCRPVYRPALRTTAELAASLTDSGETNHAVRCAAPLELPERALPIDPYVLGVWLGDGDSTSATLTIAEADMHELVARAGLPLRRLPSARGAPRYAVGYAEGRRDATTGRMMANGSLCSALRAVGVLGNKHVPPQYLRASRAQRLALLQGLMDTDGYVSASGRCEFSNTKRTLSEAVFELAASLGLKPTLRGGRARLLGRDCGPLWDVGFTAYAPDAPVFRLPRKLSRLPCRGRQAERQARRFVKEVRTVPSVPVRCIAVDDPPGLFLAGRAMIPTHNTRAGAEVVRAVAEAGLVPKIRLIGRTAADVRDVMVHGDSGLLAIAHPDKRPHHYPSKRKLLWQHNGVEALTYSAEEPDSLRGPQFAFEWWDEVCAWRYFGEIRKQALMGLRTRIEGWQPRVVMTSTPRPLPVLREMLADPDLALTRSTTYENEAHLADAFVKRIIRQFEGTNTGRQELLAEVITDTVGAHWTSATIEAGRLNAQPARAEMSRVVVAVDPSGSHKPGSSECGIVVAGSGPCPERYRMRIEEGKGFVPRPGWERELHAFVLVDDSGRYPPDEWGRRVVKLYREFRANAVVAEGTYGGEMVETIIHQVDPHVPVQLVWAKVGKFARAEPVAMKYVQGYVHHVGGFGRLEDQMTGWHPDMVDPETLDLKRSPYSPDRMDALVYGITDLLKIGEGSAPLVAPVTVGQTSVWFPT